MNSLKKNSDHSYELERFIFWRGKTKPVLSLPLWQGKTLPFRQFLCSSGPVNLGQLTWPVGNKGSGVWSPMLCTPMDMAEIITSWSGELPGSPGAQAGHAEHISTLNRLFPIALCKSQANSTLSSRGGNKQELREREGSWTRRPDLASAAALWLSFDTHFQGLFFWTFSC